MKATRARLLQVYLKEVHRNGIHNFTLLSLAKAAKMSFGAIHYHFGKADIFLEALEFSDRDGRTFVDAGMLKHKSGSLLDHYFMLNFDWVRLKPEHGTFWLYFMYESARNKKYAKMQRDYSETTTGRIQKALEIESPGLSRSASRSCAEKLFQLLIGSVLYALSQPMDREKIIKNCIDMKNTISRSG